MPALCAEILRSLTSEEILHIRGFRYRGALAEVSNVFFRSPGALEARLTLR